MEMLPRFHSHTRSHLMGSLDVSGNVNVSGTIKTGNCAFTAYASTNMESLNNQIVIWNSTLNNIGSCYSTSSGKFTAPTNGVYLFGYAFRSSPTYNNVSMSLLGNISGLGSSIYYFTNVQVNYNGYQHGCGSQMLQLSAGDTIWTYASGNATVAGYASIYYNDTFWGALLFAT